MTSKIAEKLKLIQKASNMTQKEFAAKLGIKDTTFSAYVCGKIAPPLDVIMQICDRTGVDIGWLCGRDDRITGSSVNYGDFVLTLSSIFENKDVFNATSLVVKENENGRKVILELEENTDDYRSVVFFNMLSELSGIIKKCFFD